MKYRILYILVLFLLPVFLKAQRLEDAEKLFNDGAYEEAYAAYTHILKEKRWDVRTNAMLHYRLGRCLVASESWFGSGEEHFNVALKRKYNLSYYYLGRIFFHQYRFEESVENFEKYRELRLDRLTEEQLYSLDSCIALSKQGAQMIKRVEALSIIDSVKYSKQDFFAAYSLGSDLGEIGYYTEQFKDADSTLFSGSSVFMTGRKDRMLYAQRDTVNDKLDLKISYRLIDGWSSASVLSERLSSDKDDNYPFVLPDGVTIYFASKGHNSFGGYDIYFSRYNNAIQEYTEPLNVGMPINSPYNDYMLVVDDFSNVAWFATDRYQDSDTVVVYKFVPSKSKKLLDISNADTLRMYAQLKMYDKVDVVEGSSSKAGEKKRVVEDDISFVINDTLIYTSISDFRCENAEQMYLIYSESILNIKSATEELEKKRNAYMQVDYKAKKEEIYQSILRIEEDIFKYTDQRDEYLQKIRIAEIKELQK